MLLLIGLIPLILNNWDGKNSLVVFWWYLYKSMKELINTNFKVYSNIWKDADNNSSLYCSDWLVLFISYVSLKKFDFD